MKTTLSNAQFVDPTYNLKYYGSIINLDNFFGPIKIYNNTFTSNVLKYSSCEVATAMDTATYAGTDKYAVYGSTKSVLQIRSLISVVTHYHRFEMVENVFTGNSGTKGIIMLDFHARSNFPVYIVGNSFNQNAGYIDSNVIFIRARGKDTQVVGSLVPTNDANLYCVGYHFESNVFNNNFGCS